MKLQLPDENSKVIIARVGLAVQAVLILALLSITLVAGFGSMPLIAFGLVLAIAALIIFGS